MIKRLTKEEFISTFIEPIKQVGKNESPPFDFWDYFEQIPKEHFGGYDYSDGIVDYAWNMRNHYQHVLVNCDEKNVFMVLVLNLSSRKVYGHYLLNLNIEYGLIPE